MPVREGARRVAARKVAVEQIDVDFHQGDES
jgi:hypothetical protein